MSFSASSEIFLVPLSGSLTWADRERLKEYPKTSLAAWPGTNRAPDSPERSRFAEITHYPVSSTGSRLALDGNFLADRANSLLRVFDDLTSLDSICNPIVLYGPSQTGKSLLSKGVAQRLAKIRGLAKIRAFRLANSNPGLLSDDPQSTAAADIENTEFSVFNEMASLAKAVCLSAADWSLQLQEAIETNSITEFRERFLAAGSVQIDDLNLLNNSPFAQSQLVVLLDLLTEADVPVLFTTSLHPHLLENFRADLISRLLGGMVLPVNFPGVAAKKAYLKERAYRLGLRLGDESSEWLASHAPLPTFTAIDGFLREFSVGSRLSQQAPSLAEIQAHFNLASSVSSDRLAELITETTAEFFELTGKQLKSPCRRQTTVLARGIALNLIRRLCPLSLNGLGQKFGNRDHSTILSALQSTEQRIRSEPAIRSALADIAVSLKTKAAALRIPVSTTEISFEDLIAFTSSSND